jgi:hypothetical protein
MEVLIGMFEVGLGVGLLKDPERILELLNTHVCERVGWEPVPLGHDFFFHLFVVFLVASGVSQMLRGLGAVRWAAVVSKLAGLSLSVVFGQQFPSMTVFSVFWAASFVLSFLFMPRQTKAVTRKKKQQ